MNMNLTYGLLGAVALLMASQANAATVSINPASITVGDGASFSLTVSGADFPETIGGGFSLSWDANILALTSADVDLLGQLTTAGWDTSSVSSAAGQLDVLNASFATTFTGAFDILTLDFLALQQGVTTADLALNPIQGSDWVAGDFFTAIPVTYEGATVTVGAVPVPAAVWLFGSGLIGLVGIARRRSPVVSA